jgi:hypothetical protein
MRANKEGRPEQGDPPRASSLFNLAGARYYAQKDYALAILYFAIRRVKRNGKLIPRFYLS